VLPRDGVVVVHEHHRPVGVPAGHGIRQDGRHRWIEEMIFDACAVGALFNRHAGHAAQHVERVLLMAEEVAERVIDRHLVAVHTGDDLHRLQRVRPAADHQSDAAVGEELCPAVLLGGRSRAVLCAPVDKYDHQIGLGFCLLNIGGDFVLVVERVDHIFVCGD